MLVGSITWAIKTAPWMKLNEKKNCTHAWFKDDVPESKERGN